MQASRSRRLKNSAKASKKLVKKAFKAKRLSQKSRTITLPKVTAKFGKAKCKVVAADGTRTLSLKNGKIKVKKGTTKGSYSIKLKAVVSGTSNYTGAKTKTVTVRVAVS